MFIFKYSYCRTNGTTWFKPANKQPDSWHLGNYIWLPDMEVPKDNSQFDSRLFDNNRPADGIGYILRHKLANCQEFLASFQLNL